MNEQWNRISHCKNLQCDLAEVMKISIIRNIHFGDMTELSCVLSSRTSQMHLPLGIQQALIQCSYVGASLPQVLGFTAELGAHFFLHPFGRTEAHWGRDIVKDVQWMCARKGYNCLVSCNTDPCTIPQLLSRSFPVGSEANATSAHPLQQTGHISEGWSVTGAANSDSV